MKKLAALLTAIALSAAAPFAAASNEDGLDLMPTRSEGVEITHFVREAGAPAPSAEDVFYALGTGGISPN
ncbi:MAG: hypothetical protein U1F45_10455 [Burkholderiales bacterium]